MSSITLTSLAMLKVHIDHGKDYLDYLRPFVLQILFDEKTDSVTDQIVANQIRKHFGLEIPERTIEIVLKRISRQYPLKKEHGAYKITGDMPNPEINNEKGKADKHISSIILGLIDFSKRTKKPIRSEDDAVSALLVFLSQFNIQCLKAYLLGTAIPKIEGNHDAQIILVSQYVLHLQETNPDQFASFLILLQGQMLANALLCPDLQNAPKTYDKVTFYLDSPLLLWCLGLEDETKQASIENLIELLKNLGATVATFAHCRDEVEGVIRSASIHFDKFDWQGEVLTQARKRNITKSDLLLLADQVDKKLKDASIQVIETPLYTSSAQIDEKEFDRMLSEKLTYRNPRAKETDINSVRSIYVLRAGTSPTSIERSKAIFVTGNRILAQAAFEYGQKHEESREVSSVVTDFSLANLAWLKAPMGAPSLPATEMLAFSYAALRPSTELLNKYMMEIERLEKQGKITTRDHQLLRCSPQAQDELMDLTLGDENELTEETITDTLERITNEIKKEENEKLNAERKQKDDILKQLYWRCTRRAKQFSWGIASLATFLLFLGVVDNFGLKINVPILSNIQLFCGRLVIVGSLLGLFVGFSVLKLREKLEEWALKWLLRRESATLRLDLGKS